MFIAIEFYRQKTGNPFIKTVVNEKIFNPRRFITWVFVLALHAARLWCGYASEHAAKNGGKTWKYLLVPAEAVLPNATLDALAGKFS